MASSATAIPIQTTPRSNKSVYMVLGCTVFAAAAQVLLKFGATHAMPQMNPADPSTWTPFLMALLGNYPLVLGYCAHSGNALLLILALRDGELSMLYPIIALTYVWVNLLSMYFFHENMNVWKALGIALVIGGVAFLGRASARA
jgi:multidrug transporter EmrE-like cation transporter